MKAAGAFNGLPRELGKHHAGSATLELRMIFPPSLLFPTISIIGADGVSALPPESGHFRSRSKRPLKANNGHCAGTNMVRKEVRLPQAECLAADTRYSLIVLAK